MPIDPAPIKDPAAKAIRRGAEFGRANSETQRRQGSLTEHGIVRSDWDGETHESMREIVQRQQEQIAELENFNQQWVQFLAMLSHEIRNPLAPILNALEIMRQESDETTPTLQQIRGVMERQVRQLAHLVDDLLETSRYSAGKLQLHKERVDLRVVVECAVESAGPFLQDHGHQLSVAIPDEPIMLHVDPARIEQVILNLLNNAAKYTPYGGQVRVHAQRQGDHAVISVSDNGIGIPHEMLDDIFDMFTQIAESRDQSRNGLGIGLTLVKRLAEMHGGTVAAHSEGQNRGSEFHVRLPVCENPAEQAPPSRRESPPVQGNLRVLVADDNRDAANMLSLVLKKLGAETATARDGMETIDAANAFRPDIVLMDLGMPKLDGYQAAREIRQQPWGQEILLVAVTGWGQDEDKRRTRDAGFDHHVVKPVDIAELQKILTTHPRNRMPPNP